MLDSVPQETKRLDYVDLKLSQKRQVKLRTCADVYAHWRAYKRAYKKAPREGVEFQIDYIDTGLAMSEDERSRAPIALALHGAPGSYHDFSLLIQHLAQQRVRVIAPNFPEYIATVKTKVLFRHSADEKAAYLRDFLRAINVKTIDLLVSHSSAIFPTLLILLNANKEAIARQRAQREFEGANQAEGEEANSKDLNKKLKKKTTRKSVPNRKQSSVDLESFSEIGDQVLRECQNIQQVSEDQLVYEDASDGLDDNNNSGEERELGQKQQQRHRASGSSGVSSASSLSNIENIDSIELAHDNVQKATQKHLNQVTIEIVDRYEGNQENLDGEEEPQTLTQIQTTNNETGAKKQKVKKQKKPRRSSLEPIVKFDEPIEIKAVALLNPAGHRMPKSMRPVWFKCGSVHVYQQKLGRSIFRKFGPPFLTVIGEVVRVENMDHVMLSATVMRNSKMQRLVHQLEQLSQMKIPTLLVFSENDKLIEKEIFYEMTQFMHLDPKNFDVFQNEAEKELSQSRNVDDWIRVMVFKAGGHYAYSNYAKTVNTAVSELLNKVTTTTRMNDDDSLPPPSSPSLSSTASTRSASTSESVDSR